MASNLIVHTEVKSIRTGADGQHACGHTILWRALLVYEEVADSLLEESCLHV